MKNFRETIKAPTKEDKIKEMDNMFDKVVVCSFLLSQAEKDKYVNETKKVLSREEAFVTYELLRRVRILMELPRKSIELKKNIFEFLDINNNVINNKENLYKFVMAGVKDYEENKRKNPNIAWNLPIEKIMNKLKEQEKREDTETKIIEEMEN